MFGGVLSVMVRVDYGMDVSWGGMGKQMGYSRRRKVVVERCGGKSKPGRLVCCRHWRVAVATPTPGLAASDTLRRSIDCGDSGCGKPSGSGRPVYGCPSGKPRFLPSGTVLRCVGRWREVVRDRNRDSGVRRGKCHDPTHSLISFLFSTTMSVSRREYSHPGQVVVVALRLKQASARLSEEPDPGGASETRTRSEAHVENEMHVYSRPV